MVFISSWGNLEKYVLRMGYYVENGIGYILKYCDNVGEEEKGQKKTTKHPYS